MSTPRALRLNAEDNLVIAVDEIKAGDEPASARKASERIPRGHKMATVKIETGEPIRKFGQIIGFASKPIAPGEWIHEHNCVMHDFARDYHFCEGAQARGDPARRAAGDLRGLSPRQRQDRHAQLSRRADLGELLGDGRAPDRARGRALRHARGLSQRRRRHPARARHRLRHGREGRGLRGAEAHAMGLCRQSQHGRRHHGRARAAKCSRSRA